MTTGFEVIVRPMVLPDIRPQAPRVLPPPNDPTSGIATLSGSSGGLVDLTHSEQHSWSKSKHVETKRKFDKVRIYQVDPQTGEINENNYVDVERTKTITTRMADGTLDTVTYGTPPKIDNETILEKDLTRNNDGCGTH